MLPEYGNVQLKYVNFYGKEAMVEFGGNTYTSPPLVNEEEIFAECHEMQLFHLPEDFLLI